MGSKNAIEAIKHLESLGINSVELSGGKYIENYSDELVKLAQSRINLQIHNYFPVPKVPFVLNLASENGDILKESFDTDTCSSLPPPAGAKFFEWLMGREGTLEELASLGINVGSTHHSTGEDGYVYVIQDLESGLPR